MTTFWKCTSNAASNATSNAARGICDSRTCLLPTSDGGYLLTSTWSSHDPASIAKIDSDLNMTWSRNYEDKHTTVAIEEDDYFVLVMRDTFTEAPQTVPGVDIYRIEKNGGKIAQSKKIFI